MRYLSLVRHGECFQSQKLTEKGEKQIKNVATYLNGYTSRILTSPAPRAIESVKILGKELNLHTYIMVPELWEGSDAPGGIDYSLERIIEIIKQNSKDIEGLTLLSHMFLLMQLSRKISMNYIGNGNIFTPNKDQGEIYDLKEKTYKKIPINEH